MGTFVETLISGFFPQASNLSPNHTIYCQGCDFVPWFIFFLLLSIYFIKMLVFDVMYRYLNEVHNILLTGYKLRDKIQNSFGD